MADPLTGTDLQQVDGRRPLPEMIELDPEEGMPPHSPREMSMVQAELGCSPDEVTDVGDAEAMLVWFKLRRMGYDPTFEEARDVIVKQVVPTPPNAGD
jgi:hypothetical protein